MGIVSVKLIMKNKRNDLREYECNAQEQEWKSVIQITNQQNSCPFILKYKRYNYNHQGEGIAMDYANMGTLNIIAKQPHIPLPSHTLRALMKQILEGVRVIHATNLIHRDIKCDNILLHSPPGSERVYVKIADFGLAKKEDSMYELTNAGKIVQLESIGRPQEIKDDILWDLLSKLLEFDPDKRITAEQAIQHPYFTSPQAIADISKEQQDLAKLTIKAQLQEGDSSITEFDKDPTFIVAESVIQQFILEDISLKNQLQQQIYQPRQSKKESELLTENQSQTAYEINGQIHKDSLNNQQQIVEQIQQIEYDQNIQTLNQKSAHSTQSDFSFSLEVYSQNQSSQSSISKSTLDKTQQSVYSIHSHSIPKTHSNQASLSYIATEQQLQVEQDLIELDMTLEEIKEKYKNSNSLSLQQLEIISVNLYKRLEESNESNDNIKKSIQIGLIDDLINILNTLPVEKIYQILCDPIVILLRLCDKEQKQLVIQKGAIRLTLRMLLSENEDVINCGLYNIHKIIGAYLTNEEEGKPNILRQQLEKDEILNRIIQIFNNQYKYQHIKYHAGFAIACIFKATQLPSEFGPQVINNLKSHIRNKIGHLLHYSLIALSFIAECRQNHDQILFDEYLQYISSIFNEKWTEEFYPLIFIFLSKLFKFGNDQTKEKIKNQINKNKVEELLNHQNPQIIKDADEYLKLIYPQSCQNNNNINGNENQKENKNVKIKIIKEQQNQQINESIGNQKLTIKQQQDEQDEGTKNIEQNKVHNEDFNQQEHQMDKIQEKENEQKMKNDQDQEQTNETQNIGEQRIKELNRIDEYLEGKQEQKQKSNSQEIEDSNSDKKKNQDQKDKSNEDEDNQNLKNALIDDHQ